MKQEISAVVILYNPDDLIIENIKSYHEKVGFLFIIDNSDNPKDEIISQIKSLEKSKYISFNENKGIGTALNLAANLSIERGFKYLLTMDQDSKITDDMILKLFNLFSVGNDIALAVPFIQNKYNTKNATPGRNYEVRIAMTSGSLLKLDYYTKIGPFSEDYFIDYIDTEYCLRISNNGYKIITSEDACLNHNEADIFPVKVFGKTFYPYNHSAVRFYYKSRNRRYLRETFKETDPDYLKIEKKIFYKTVFKAILWEENKIEKIKMILRGIKDYKKGIVGRYQN